MTILEAADYLRVSTSTMRRLINSDQVPAAKVRTQIRIRREDLDALLRNN